jgi:hypothetical protein
MNERKERSISLRSSAKLHSFFLCSNWVRRCWGNPTDLVGDHPFAERGLLNPGSNVCIALRRYGGIFGHGEECTSVVEKEESGGKLSRRSRESRVENVQGRDACGTCLIRHAAIFGVVERKTRSTGNERTREDVERRERPEEREWRGKSRFISRRSSPLTASSSVEWRC